MVELPQGAADPAGPDIAARPSLAEADAQWLLEAVLDHSPRGVIMLGPDGRAVHLNAKAGELLIGNRLARLDGDRLVFAEPAHAVQAAVDAALSGAAERNTWVLVPSARQQFVFTVTPLSRSGTPSGRFALILMQALLAGDTAHQARLRKLFGLTAAEAAVASGIAEGATLSEIAEARGVAQSTVRMQLKAVMRKLGCRRQAEVAARVCGVHAVHGER